MVNRKLPSKARDANHPGANLEETHLRSILSTVQDAMVVIDNRGIILSFSVAAERMFGFRELELIGENVSVLMPRTA